MLIQYGHLIDHERESDFLPSDLRSFNVVGTKIIFSAHFSPSKRLLNLSAYITLRARSFGTIIGILGIDGICVLLGAIPF